MNCRPIRGDLCLDVCPQGVLDEECRTDQMKRLKSSRPRGIARTMEFTTGTKKGGEWTL